MDKNSHFKVIQIMTTETSRKGRQARRIKIKKKSLNFKTHRSTPGYDQDI